MRGNFNHSISGEIPPGLPEKDGLPLYPDPNVYPAWILAGYNEWPMIFWNGSLLSYRAINPKAETARTMPTLRVGDSIEHMRELFGAPNSEERYPHMTEYIANYSEEVKVALSSNLVEAIFLPDLELGDPDFDTTNYRNWNFVFVESRS